MSQLYFHCSFFFLTEYHNKLEESKGNNSVEYGKAAWVDEITRNFKICRRKSDRMDVPDM